MRMASSTSSFQIQSLNGTSLLTRSLSGLLSQVTRLVLTMLGAKRCGSLRVSMRSIPCSTKSGTSRRSLTRDSTSRKHQAVKSCMSRLAIESTERTLASTMSMSMANMRDMGLKMTSGSSYLVQELSHLAAKLARRRKKLTSWMSLMA